MVTYGKNARFAETALVNGEIGLLIAPRGQLQAAITFTIDDDTISGYELITSPARLHQLDLAALDR